MSSVAFRKGEAASGCTQLYLPPKHELPLKTADLAPMQCFAELHIQARVCKTKKWTSPIEVIGFFIPSTS